ncbi:MAG: hypothetical protein JXB47_17790 [Anaerolineae bacterium]|nr:hypothetical protein [Anaerolineae bacterium]
MLDESEKSPEMLVQQLKEITLAYEALDEQIDTLLAQYGGQSEKMPRSAYEQYRALAAERADIYNQMKHLERLLFDDDA